jgi:hypothetical protein
MYKTLQIDCHFTGLTRSLLERGCSPAVIALVLSIYGCIVFRPSGEKPGALWATKEEKYRSAEG